MDFTAWYAVALGSCVAVIIGAKVTQQTLKLEFLGYRHVDRYLGVSGSKVRSALILLTLLIGNILGLTLYVHDPADFIKRSGLLSIVNIAPLMLGGHINLVADRCGISLASYATAHRWLGRICIIESIIHAAARYHFFNVDFHKLQETTGLVAVIILVLVFFSGPLRFY
ncbi:hypothetical protein J7T55_002168, partial [Diaporthe amygdali]|uniref:uncharacterized protein n=1 Tax=Phomopsis amygdali TaxID=1214568 RepID=UPI0022FE1A76